jgi:hypothetical protein
MVVDDPLQLELMLSRFRRLIGELQSGKAQRNQFEPWEIDILLDLETCRVDRRRWIAILRQYEKAVERQIEGGHGPPMRLSEFLALRYRKPVGRA